MAFWAWPNPCVATSALDLLLLYLSDCNLLLPFAVCVPDLSSAPRFVLFDLAITISAFDSTVASFLWNEFE